MQSSGGMGPTGEDVLAPLGQVADRQGLAALAARLEALRSWLCDDLSALEQALGAVEEQDTLPGTRVRGAVGHLLALRGKRIRPLCVLLAARLGNHLMDDVIFELAMACELVHAATLLHDDVIDEAQERRGAPAARVVYGNSASILAGDHLLVQALQRVLGTGQTALLGGLLEVIAKMVAAEALQLERRGRFAPDRQIYLDVIRGKTAALFAWGLQAGGSVAGLDAATLSALGRVGTHLGMAFQLVDDVLDLEGDPQLTGKDALVDVREGKLTWPMILGAERDPLVRRELTRLAAEPGRELDLERARALLGRLRDSGALQATRAYARRKADEACEQIATLPAGRSRTAMVWVVESAVERMQ